MAYPKKKSPKAKVVVSTLKRKMKKVPKTQKKTLTYKAAYKDSVKNPENQPYVKEVSFNKGVPEKKVTQEQFNKRYGIKY